MNAPVPRDLVNAVLVALVHPRPILVTSAAHLRDIELQTQRVVHALLGPADSAPATPPPAAPQTPQTGFSGFSGYAGGFGSLHVDGASIVVPCSGDLSWPVLAARLAERRSRAVLLRHVERLAPAVQLHLGYALMQPDAALRELLSDAALIFLARLAPEDLHPFLRRQILLKLDVRLDEDLPMVELPRQMGSAGTGAATAAAASTGGASYAQGFDSNGNALPRRAADATDAGPATDTATDTGNDSGTGPAGAVDPKALAAALAEIRTAVPRVTIVPELLRYHQDILLFVRTHRFASVGLRPQAARDFELLTRTMCVLRGRSFANPAVVKAAARLALPVHVRLVRPEDEPSLQYGGELDTVRDYIAVWDGDVLVDAVLEQVPVPR